MADYDSTEIILPDSWVGTTLDEVTDTTRQRRHPQEYPELSYIGLENVESETMHLLGTQPTSALKSMADYFEPGDVLYARLRPYLNKVYRPEFEGLCSSEFIIFRELDNLNNKYLQYLINSWEFVSFAMGKITGDRPRANMDDLGDFPFPLAPLNEQRRIVDEIEAQFSRLDTWLKVMEKLRIELPRLRTSILKAAVEGHLVDQEPDDEPANVLLQRILDERRRKWEEDFLADLAAKGKPAPKNDKWKERYIEPVQPDTDDLPELPNGWVWANVAQLADVQTGATPLTSKNAYYMNGTIPWVTSSTVNNLFIDEPSDYITELAIQETNAKVFPIGTLLVAMYGQGKTRGNVSELRIEAATNQACAALIFEDTALGCKDFVKLFFRKNYHDLRSLASGGAQPNLNLSIVRDTIIPMPPIDEQARIMVYVDSLLSVIDRLEATITINTKRVEKMRQSVLKQAFEGRLVEQDPNDEPASELLKRIQDERKHRAEEEKKKPKQQRERKVSTKTERKSLYDTLKEAGKPLSARELFQQAGFNQDTIDIFYEQLREILRQNENVRVWRENDDTFLEVSG